MGFFEMIVLEPEEAAALVGRMIAFQYLGSGEVRKGWVLSAERNRCAVAYEYGGRKQHYVLWRDVVEILEPTPTSDTVTEPA